jgi:hypothetical protein
MGGVLDCCHYPGPPAVPEIPESIFMEARGIRNDRDDPQAPFIRPRNTRSDRPPTFETEVDFFAEPLSSDDGPNVSDDDFD